MSLGFAKDASEPPRQAQMTEDTALYERLNLAADQTLQQSHGGGPEQLPPRQPEIPAPEVLGSSRARAAALAALAAVLLAASAFFALSAGQQGEGTAGPHLRGGGGSSERHAPARLLAAAGGSAVAGAWFSVGHHIGACWAAVGHFIGQVCVSVFNFAQSVWHAIGKCSSEVCGGTGTLLGKMPWCGNCVWHVWSAFGALFGGCWHALGDCLGGTVQLFWQFLSGAFSVVGRFGTNCWGACGSFLEELCPC